MLAISKASKPIIAAVLIGIAGLFAVPAYSASDGNEDARAALEEAAKLRDGHDLRGANVAALNAIKEDPDWPLGHIARAEISLGLFDAVTAKAELEKALSLGTPRAELNHLIGEALWLLGEYDLAEKALLDPDLNDPRRAHALRILGRVYMERGQLDKARDTFDNALGIEGDSSIIWTDIGRYRLLAGDQKAALEAVDKAVELYPENVRALTLRGRITRNQVGVLPALTWFERALEISPNDVPTLEEYGATLGEVGRYRDMLEVARKIISLDRQNGRAYYLQAVIAARAGDYGLTQRILALAGSKINQLPGAMLMAGIAEYQMGNLNKSIDIFKRLLEQQPQNLRVRKLLALATYRSGDAVGALQEIRPLAIRRDADSYSLRIAGRAFEANGQRLRAAGGLDNSARPSIAQKDPLSDARSDLNISESARRNPDNARYVVPHIRVLMRKGNLGSALSLAQRLRKKNPGVANAHMIEGDVLLKRGSLAAAELAYGRAAQISFTAPVMLRLANIYRLKGDGDAQRTLVASFVRNNPNSLPALRLLAYYQLDDGNWQQATGPLEYVLWRTGYNDSVLLANLARAWMGAGDLDKAADYAAISYRIDPANPMVTKVYGQVLLAKGTKPKAAFELLEKASILVPDDKQVAADLKKARKAYKRK